MANLSNAWAWGLQKPVLGSQINWSHPLARSMVGCWLLNEQGGAPVDLATGTAGSGGTSYVPGGGPGGYGRMLNAPTVGYTGASAPFNKNRDLSTTGNQWTISRLVKIATIGNQGSAIFEQWAGSSSTQANLFVYYINSSTISVDIPFVVNVVNASGFTVGTVERVTITRNGSAWTVYRNNVVVATASSAASHIAISSVATYFNKEGSGGSSNYDWNGNDFGTQMWRRCLTPREVAWLSAEPYSFIKGPGY